MRGGEPGGESKETCFRRFSILTLVGANANDQNSRQGETNGDVHYAPWIQRQRERLATSRLGFPVPLILYHFPFPPSPPSPYHRLQSRILSGLVRYN